MKRILFPLLAAFALHAGEHNNKEQFFVKDYSCLLGLQGFSDDALKLHFELYRGYVSNTNLLTIRLKSLRDQGRESSPEFQTLKRHYMWEYDGMRLHELYFDNLCKGFSELKHDDPLFRQIEETFGSFAKWKEDFIGTGAIRGIGWSVLYLDVRCKRLVNCWVNEHNEGHLAGGVPLLVMDVFEHAYLLDYGIDKNKYIQAFFCSVNWNIVSDRYHDALTP